MLLNLTQDDIRNSTLEIAQLEEGMCVRAFVCPGYYSNKSENEFLQHSEEYRGVLGQERAQGRA